MKHFLQFTDLTVDELAYVFTRASLIKRKFKAYENTTLWRTVRWP